MPTYTDLASLQAAANQGDARDVTTQDGQYQMGLRYQRANNHTEAVKQLTLAAEQDPPHLDALCKLGQYYEHGWDEILADPTKAVECYQLAETYEHAEGKYLLAMCFERGIGVQDNAPDLKQAFQLYSEASGRTASGAPRFAPALFKLALCYYQGLGTDKNPTAAFKYFNLAANQNLPEAHYRLGLCHYHGHGAALDHDAAITCFSTAADLGNLEAPFKLAQCFANHEIAYVQARHLQQNAQWAKPLRDELQGMHPLGTRQLDLSGLMTQCLKTASDSGHVEAQYQLAHHYHATKNNVQAVHYYKMAAAQNHIEALNTLGVCYLNGTGVAQDRATAVAWWKKAARAGDIGARSMLRHLAMQPTIEHLNKEAHAGIPEAQYQLAMLYDRGEHIEHDRNAAFEWCTKAANQDHPAAKTWIAEYQDATFTKDLIAKIDIDALKSEISSAQYELGMCYIDGICVIKQDYECIGYVPTNTEEDRKIAATWFQKAAQHGHQEAQKKHHDCTPRNSYLPYHDDNPHSKYIHISHGLSLVRIQDVDGNDVEAWITDPQHQDTIERLLKIAHHKVPILDEQAEAQYQLGIDYARGQHHVAQDHQTAHEWFTKAAALGHSEAQKWAKQYATLEQWILKAEEGDAQAQYNLGICYKTGAVVKRNHNKAIRWFVAATQQGHVEALAMLTNAANAGRIHAQHALHVCYREGTGVTADPATAAQWHEKAQASHKAYKEKTEVEAEAAEASKSPLPDVADDPLWAHSDSDVDVDAQLPRSGATQTPWCQQSVVPAAVSTPAWQQPAVADDAQEPTPSHPWLSNNNGGGGNNRNNRNNSSIFTWMRNHPYLTIGIITSLVTAIFAPSIIALLALSSLPVLRAVGNFLKALSRPLQVLILGATAGAAATGTSAATGETVRYTYMKFSGSAQPSGGGGSGSNDDGSSNDFRRGW